MTSQLIRVILNSKVRSRAFHATTTQQTFHERDDRAGYPHKYDRLPEMRKFLSDPIQDVLDVCRFLKVEMAKWWKEVKTTFMMSPIFIWRKDEVDVVWKFSNNIECLDEWVVTCDSDYDQGYSTAKLELSSYGKGVFSGILNTKLPKDGVISYSGYCNIMSVPYFISFQRQRPRDWSAYNHLVMRVRGDGRTYLLVIRCKGVYDILWNDTYHYMLYTHGGPYWQYVRIPFSKFFFGSKGRIQEQQMHFDTLNVTKFGITIADKVPGQFRLEIDYIGLEFDITHREEYAYELYKMDNVLF